MVIYALLGTSRPLSVSTATTLATRNGLFFNLEMAVNSYLESHGNGRAMRQANS